MGKTDKPCVAHKEWDKMSVAEKVEVLGDWAVKMTAWADGVQAKSGNGGPPPPKHPKDPGC